jgi:hypothetical protein
LAQPLGVRVVGAVAQGFKLGVKVIDAILRRIEVRAG